MDGMENPPDARTIFVSVASYRDTQCPTTIRSLLEHAAVPDRVFIGICEQNTLDPSESCVAWDDPLLRRFYTQIRRVAISDRDAAGPCHARYLCSLLYKDEDYFMQIDSHSLMVDAWDRKCIRLLDELPDPSRSILSYYPIPEDQYSPDPPPSTAIPVITSHFLNREEILQWNAAGYTHLNGKSVVSPYMAAGFFFAPGRFVEDVPFDPFLPYVFMGEEALLTLRAFTAGYDIYTPHLSLVYHTYSRTAQPSVYSDHSSRPGYEAALGRVRRLLGLTDEDPPVMPSEDRYGLGTVRTLHDYWKTIGFLKERFEMDLHRLHPDRGSFGRRDAIPVVLTGALLLAGLVVFVARARYRRGSLYITS